MIHCKMQKKIVPLFKNFTLTNIPAEVKLCSNAQLTCSSYSFGMFEFST